MKKLFLKLALVILIASVTITNVMGFSSSEKVMATITPLAGNIAVFNIASSVPTSRADTDAIVTYTATVFLAGPIQSLVAAANYAIYGYVYDATRAATQIIKSPNKQYFLQNEAAQMNKLP